VRLLPGILLVALAAALFSRFGGLQPPLLAGVLSGTLILRSPPPTPRRRRAAGPLAVWGLPAPPAHLRPFPAHGAGVSASRAGPDSSSMKSTRK